MSTPAAKTAANAGVDIFTPIHKGLRRALFETAIQLGRTDFSSEAETAAAERAVSACLTFLREHAEHEDHQVLPQIEALSPGLADAIAAEHPRLERAAIDVESLFPRLAPLGGAERAAMGGEIGRRFQALVAEQLRHMDREEREVNALFWARLPGDEIQAISGRIVADIAPPRMGEWMELVLPSLSGAERAALAARRAA